MGPLRFVRDYISWHHEFAAHDPNSHQVELMFEAYLESEPSFPSQPDSMQEGFLRGNAALREAYAREKLRIAEMVDWDKAAYSLAKGPFIESILERHGP